MTIRIGNEAPNFTAETTQGEINLHQWIGDGWALLFSHPKDFTLYVRRSWDTLRACRLSFLNEIVKSLA